MLRVRVFDGISVTGAGQPLGPAAHQPKRLALLAIVACSGQHGVTRDHLLACLWPDSNAARARNALNQALHGLRRDLRIDDLFEGREILRLNPNVASSDVGDFDAAIAAGRLDEAVDHYAGPLLVGVHLREGPAFEEWLDRARSVLVRRFEDALRQLIARARADGNLATALKFARRLLDAQPYDASAVRQVMELLAATGNFAGATRVAESYIMRLTTELQLAPDAAIVKQLEELRSSGAAWIAIPTGSPNGAATRATSDAPTAPPEIPIVKTYAQSHRASVAFALLAVTVFVLAILRRDSEARDRAATTHVAVLSFSVSGDSQQSYLADGMAKLVALGLDGTGSIRAGAHARTSSIVNGALTATDSAARLVRRLQLDRYVTGTVVASGGRVEIEAILHDATRGGRALGRATAGGASDSLFQLGESLSRRLLAFEPSVRSTLIRSRFDATVSLAAFRAFVNGETLFRASRFTEAVAAYQHAIVADSTFALAYHALSVAADWSGQGELIAPAALAAKRLSPRLPWRERLLLDGAMAWRDGRNAAAESTFRELTSRDRNDAEAWFQLAEVLFHSNAIRGRSFLEARGPFEEVARIDPRHRGALTHLARIEAYVGNTVAVDTLIRAAWELMPREQDQELLLFHAVATGALAARDSVLTSFALQPTPVVRNAAMRLSAYARNLFLADSILRTARRLGRSRDPDVLTTSLYVAAGLGQLDRALLLSDTLGAHVPYTAIEARAMIATLPHVLSAEAASASLLLVERLGAARVSTRSDRSWAVQAGLERVVRWYLLGLGAVRRGDTDALGELADFISQLELAPTARRAADALASGLRAHRLALLGDRLGALRVLESSPDPGDQSLQGQIVMSQPGERFLKAKLLEELGRTAEALDVYGSLIFGHGTEVLLTVPASLRRARLLARLGRVSEARADYGVVLSTWASADAPLKPVVDSARAELMALQKPARSRGRGGD